MAPQAKGTEGKNTNGLSPGIPDKRPQLPTPPEEAPRKRIHLSVPLILPEVSRQPTNRVGISTRFSPASPQADGLLCRQRARPSGTLNKSRLHL